MNLRQKSNQTASPKRPGFTLLELVISLGIFMMFMTAVLGSYLQITDLQRRTNLSRENIAETRELIQFISSEAKEKSIDYSCYQSATCPGGIVGNSIEEISLISKNGLERTIIRKQTDPDTHKIYLSSESGSRTNSNSNLWINTPSKQLHSSSLEFQNVAFQLSPNQNPFSRDLNVISNNNLQFQPVLHLVFDLKKKDSQNDDPLVFETSISSRIYHSL